MRAYLAADLFFNVPLIHRSQLRKTLKAVFPAKFLLRISVVRTFQRLTVRAEDAKKVAALLKAKSFKRKIVDPLSPNLLI